MMMNNFNTFGMSSFGFGLHRIFSLMILVGLIFLVIWAVRAIKKEQLGKWAGWLIAIGLLGWLLSTSFGGWGSSMMGQWGAGRNGMMMKGMMNGGGWNAAGMQECMQDEACYGQMQNMMRSMMGIETDEK